MGQALPKDDLMTNAESKCPNAQHATLTNQWNQQEYRGPRMPDHPSNSAIQRAAQAEIPQKISHELGCQLFSAEIAVGTPKPLEIDGYCESPPILCEVYAHIGKLNGA